MAKQHMIKGMMAGALLLAGAQLAEAAGAATQPTICTRSCWGARAPRSTPTQMASLSRAVIHHTAGTGDFNTTSQSTSASIMRAIQNFHMDVNGWADIGYHFTVDKLGNRFEGRSGSMSSLPRGAHDGTNSNSFGFTYLGYFHTPVNHQPPVVMRQAIYDLIAWRMPNGWSPMGGGTYNGRTAGWLAGHRDVDATVCPGDTVYQFIGSNTSAGEARTEISSRINGVTVTVDNTDAGFSASTNWSTST